MSRGLKVGTPYTWAKKVGTPYSRRPELMKSWYTWIWPLAGRCTVIIRFTKNYGTAGCTVYHVIIPVLATGAQSRDLVLLVHPDEEVHRLIVEDP